ncbi:MAG: NAD(P)-binding domain-containing protein [Clostridia bacterium]|nr:NAD(P)-binding domain-containing protein [Clostridia bacterium]
MNNNNVTVIGSGRWGSFIAWYLSTLGKNVLIYGRGDSERFNALRTQRGNEHLKYNDTVSFTDDLKKAIEHADAIYVSISAQAVRDFMRQLALVGVKKEKIIVLCMKGLEERTGERLSTIVSSTLHGHENVAIWVGPGHVQDFLAGRPNCMVIDSAKQELVPFLAEDLTSHLIRFYKGDDIIGNEVGAAAKNVIGIAAGALDGLGCPALKGALMARGAREVGRLIAAMGGKGISAYGLAHLGDYEATLFSEFSHNRKYGRALAEGKQFDSLAEGRSTSKALMVLSALYDVDMPICTGVYEVIYSGADIKTVINDMFLRNIKKEF